MSKKKKVRVDFRKNRANRAQKVDWTGKYDRDALCEDGIISSERVSGKGELTRRRTVFSEDVSDGEGVRLSVDETACRLGRVLSVHGLNSEVQDESGVIYRCTTRRILKTLATDLRHVVAAGDKVLFRPENDSEIKEGFIERVEPRQEVLSRQVRGRRQILVANIDLVAIVASVAEPRLKPNLIDRMILA
ncbi:MAG: GTPase RsgA, partial [Thermoguttaceae bacterium]